MIVTKWHGGKGSKRRPEKPGQYQDQWERIFGKPKPEVKEHKKTPKHGVTKVHRDRTKYNRKRVDKSEFCSKIDI